MTPSQVKDESVVVEPLVIGLRLLDLFCGNAELAAAAKVAGVAAVGAECFRGTKLAPCTILDLALPWAQEFVLSYVSAQEARTAVWVSFPEFTFALTRGSGGPKRKRDVAETWDAGLRTREALWGTAEALQGPRATQIAEANSKLELCMEVVTEAQRLGAPWFVAASYESALWLFPFWDALKSFGVSFQACAYGGARCSWVHVLSNQSWIAGLEASCGKATCGAVSGVKQTMTRGLALKVTELMVADGWTDMPASPAQGASTAAFEAASHVIATADAEQRRNLARATATAGWQSRGRALGTILPEHKETVTVEVATLRAAELKRMERLRHRELFGEKSVPKDSQVLQVNAGGAFTKGTMEVTFGVPWSPWEFLERAVELPHPFALVQSSDLIVRAIFESLTSGPVQVRKRQEDWFTVWETRAKVLEEAEAKLCGGLHEDLRKQAVKMRPLLSHEILKSVGFPGADLYQQNLVQGVLMFGPLPSAGCFPRREHEATLTLQQLRGAAEWAVRSLAAERPRVTDKEVEAELWRLTLEEVALEEARGPFTEAQMRARHPNGFVPAKRFPVVQKAVRPCDDYSKFGHNSTSQTSEVVDTDGPDRIVGVARAWVEAIGTDMVVRVILEDGTQLEAKLHGSLTKADVLELVARLVDLRRAYKQLRRSPSQSDLTVFSVREPGGDVYFFEAVAVGFGARNAVPAFNTHARAIKHVACTALAIPVSHFFDDFSQVEPRKFAEGNSAALERLMKLLGWNFKDEPEHLKEPAECFHPLGVTMDFSEAGFVIVGNTEKRLEKALKEVGRLADADTIPEGDVLSLLGVAQFMESQTQGRSGALVMKRIRAALRLRFAARKTALARAISDLGEHISATVPRRVYLSHRLPPVVVLTDAAAETSGVTLGAVIADKVTGTCEFWAAVVENSTVETWKAEGKRQVIGQAELLAVPVALATWEKVLRNRDVLVFIDNDSATACLVRGNAIAAHSDEIANEARLISAQFGCACWYDRVPSPSNPADLPSRGLKDELRAQGFVEVPWRLNARLSALCELGVA